MKKETRICISITIILVVLLGLCIYFHGITKGRLELEENRAIYLEQQIEFYQNALDVSQKEVLIYEDSVKMHMENEALLRNSIEKLRKQMADAVKEIETMPADEQIILFDEFTGKYESTVLELREQTVAVAVISRIKRANQTMTEVVYLREDVDLLERIVQENKNIIDLQMDIIGQKDLQLSVKDSIIDLQRVHYALLTTENKQLQKTANLHKMLNYVIGGAALLVLVIN